MEQGGGFPGQQRVDPGELKLVIAGFYLEPALLCFHFQDLKFLIFEIFIGNENSSPQG